jgi:hypothetical protein
MDFRKFDPGSRAGLRPGQSSNENDFRIRARCHHDDKNGRPCGDLGLQVKHDWSNFTRLPHHRHGNERLYARRRALLLRLNQVEGAFAALKAANRTGAAGTDRFRVRSMVTYDALLSLAHLGRAALVLADQRQQRGLHPYVQAPGPTPPIPAAPASRPGSVPVSASVARRRARRVPATAGANAARVASPVDPAIQMLRGRGRPAQRGAVPSWAQES